MNNNTVTIKISDRDGERLSTKQLVELNLKRLRKVEFIRFPQYPLPRLDDNEQGKIVTRIAERINRRLWYSFLGIEITDEETHCQEIINDDPAAIEIDDTVVPRRICLTDIEIE